MGIVASSQALSSAMATGEGIVNVLGSKYVSVSCRGMLPRGYWDEAGSGALVLTRSSLYFTPVGGARGVPPRRIPLAAITGVTVEARFQGRPLLGGSVVVVTFASSVADGTGPGGSAAVGFTLGLLTRVRKGAARALADALRSAALQAHNDVTDAAYSAAQQQALVAAAAARSGGAGGSGGSSGGGGGSSSSARRSSSSMGDAAAAAVSVSNPAARR